MSESRSSHGRRDGDRENTRLLRRGEELAHLGSWHLDAATGAITWSAGLRHLLGDAAGNCGPTPESPLGPCPAEAAAELAAAIRRALAEGLGFTRLHRLERADGVVRTVQVTAEPTRDGSGRTTGLFGVVHDVTEARQHADALAARLRLQERPEDEPLEQLLRATLDEAELLTGSSIGFYHFVTGDQQHLALQTWSTNTLARMCTAEGAGRHYPVAEAGIWADCVRQGRPVVHNDYANAPHRRGLPQGHAVIVRELVVPVLRNGRVCAVLGVGNKPTDYHATDVEAVALLADLAWDLAEHRREREARRTLERRLLQAQKLESLGVLAAGVSHAYNNLLQQIAGNLEVASLQALPEPVRECIGNAMRAALRADELTRQMLAYAGSAPVARERQHFDAFVQRRAELLRALAPPIQTMRFDLAAGQASADVDPAQVQQILVHLLRNATEAFAGRPGTIVVRTGCGPATADELALSPIEPRPAPGEFAWIEVEDDGPGMDEATLQRIFDPFFTTKLAGRGLGLPAVFGIVRAHGGALLVNSAPGRGTAIRALFRAALASATAAAPPPRAPARAAGRGRVLVVDDEPCVRDVCANYLRHLGYTPVLAADGDEAVATFATDPGSFRAVVTDLMMSGRDGLAVTAALKALRPDLPVILSSGYRQSAVEAAPGDPGPDAFLRKPYLMADLRDVLAHVLGEAEGAATGA